MLDDPTQVGPTAFISGGTLQAGFQDAKRGQPDNEFVQKMQAEGFDYIEVWSCTPLDVLRYRKLLSNTFGDATDLNIIECTDSVVDVRSAWTAHSKEANYTASDMPTTGEFTYNKMHDKFVLKEFANLYGSSISTFKSACYAFDFMDSIEAYQEFRELYDGRADDLNPACKDVGVILANCMSYLKILETFKDSMSLDALKVFALEGCALMWVNDKAVDPLPDGCQFAFGRQRAEFMNAVLRIKMFGSTALKAEVRAQQLASRVVESGSNKRRRLATADTKKVMQRLQAEPDFSMDAVGTDVGQRPAESLDLLKNTVFKPVTSLRKTDINSVIVAKCVQACLVFCFYKKVDILINTLQS